MTTFPWRGVAEREAASLRLSYRAVKAARPATARPLFLCGLGKRSVSGESVSSRWRRGAGGWPRRGWLPAAVGETPSCRCRSANAPPAWRSWARSSGPYTGTRAGYPLGQRRSLFNRGHRQARLPSLRRSGALAIRDAACPSPTNPRLTQNALTHHRLASMLTAPRSPHHPWKSWQKSLR
jgi:hypothetical protein